jgi:hypothetical protein
MTGFAVVQYGTARIGGTLLEFTGRATPFTEAGMTQATQRLQVGPQFEVVMRIHRVSALAVALFLALIVVTFMSRPTFADDSTDRGTVRGCDPHCYNSDYVFAATRELHDSSDCRTLVAALSPLTVALDVALLPFEVFLGFVD